MVRSYILTDREREIIRFYLSQEKALNGYRELKHLVSGLELKRLEEDLSLIREFDRSLLPMIGGGISLFVSSSSRVMGQHE